jgi:hypothetical protein
MCRIVQGCQFGALLYVTLDIVVYQHRLLEVFAAMSHAVTHCLYLRDAFDHAMDRMHKRLHDHVNPYRMIWDIQHHLVVILAGRFVGKYAVGQPDSFKQSFCQDPGAVLHVKQLILD